MLPCSARASGIRAVILNGTTLFKANCGSRIRLCQHPNLSSIWKSADVPSWKDCSPASILRNICQKKIPLDVGLDNCCLGKTTQEHCHRTLWTDDFRKTLLRHRRAVLFLIATRASEITTASLHGMVPGYSSSYLT